VQEKIDNSDLKLGIWRITHRRQFKGTLKEITPFEVMKIVKSIKNTKSVGLDDKSSRVLKLATDALSIPPIASILNNSIKQNIFTGELNMQICSALYIKSIWETYL